MLRCNEQYLERFARSFLLEGRTKSTMEDRVRGIKRFVIAFGDRDFLAIPKEELENYAIENRRYQHTIKSMKKLYSVLGRKEAVSSIRLENRRRDIDSDTVYVQRDIDAMLGACRSKRDAALIRLLWDTGARPEEVLTMTHGSLDLAGRPAHVTLHGGHTKHTRTIPIEDDTARAIISYLDSSARLDTGLLWVCEEQSRRVGALGGNGLNHMLKAVAWKAHIDKYITAYVLRHSAATRDGSSGNYTEFEMDMKYDWTFGSDTVKIYMHPQPSILDRKYVKFEDALPLEKAARDSVIERLDAIERLIKKGSCDGSGECAACEDGERRCAYRKSSGSG